MILHGPAGIPKEDLTTDELTEFLKVRIGYRSRKRADVDDGFQLQFYVQFPYGISMGFTRCSIMILIYRVFAVRSFRRICKLRTWWTAYLPLPPDALPSRRCYHRIHRPLDGLRYHCGASNVPSDSTQLGQDDHYRRLW